MHYVIESSKNMDIYSYTFVLNNTVIFTQVSFQNNTVCLKFFDRIKGRQISCLDAVVAFRLQCCFSWHGKCLAALYCCWVIGTWFLQLWGKLPFAPALCSPGFGHTTTSASSTCWWNTSPAASCSAICETGAGSITARASSTRRRSCAPSSTCTPRRSFTETWNPRIYCWTVKGTSSSQTLALLKNWATGNGHLFAKWGVWGLIKALHCTSSHSRWWKQAGVNMPECYRGKSDTVSKCKQCLLLGLCVLLKHPHVIILVKIKLYLVRDKPVKADLHLCVEPTQSLHRGLHHCEHLYLCTGVSVHQQLHQQSSNRLSMGGLIFAVKGAKT